MVLRNADGSRRRDERQRHPLSRVGRRARRASASDGGWSSIPTAGRREVEVLDARASGSSSSPTVDMGAVTFEPSEIPHRPPRRRSISRRRITAPNTGVTLPVSGIPTWCCSSTTSDAARVDATRSAPRARRTVPQGHQCRVRHPERARRDPYAGVGTRAWGRPSRAEPVPARPRRSPIVGVSSATTSPCTCRVVNSSSSWATRCASAAR